MKRENKCHSSPVIRSIFTCFLLAGSIYLHGLPSPELFNPSHLVYGVGRIALRRKDPDLIVPALPPFRVTGML